MSDLSKRLAALSPEMRELLLKKLAQEKATTSRSDAIATRETADSYPLSFAQQRLWFLDQYEANTSLYNVPIGLRFTGSLNVAALKGSLEQLFSRHESLRTTFVDVEGKPRQVIAEHVQVQLPLVDISGLPEADREREAWRLAKEEAKGAFDLATGPLLRTTLLRIDATDHLLLLTMHHIVTDRWSNQILKQELMERYEAHVTSRTPVLKPLAVQYADFAIWQQKQLSGQGVERLISYWKQQLQGAPALLDLPTDRPRPPLQTFAGAVAAKRLSLPLSQGIRELARTEDVTLFMLMLTAFQVLLSRYSGQSDIVVGSPISGRNREEIVGLIGFFVNTLVLRTDLSGRPSFQDALKRVRETVLSAFDHQDLPFERIVDELQIERDPSTSPLFQVTFTLQQDEPTRANGEGLQVAPIEVLNDTSKFDLELFVTDCAEGFLLELQYNTDLFDTQTATRMLAHLETLLEGVVADVAQEVDLLPLMKEAEKQQLLVTWNATMAEQVGDACIHRQFEAQVAQTPEWIAAVFEERTITYGELNTRANQLASLLQRYEVGADVRVGIYMNRSLDMLVAMLGVLKAGGAYVPLDPAYPPERLAYLISDAQMPVLVTQQALVSQLPEHTANVIALDAQESELDAECGENLPDEQMGSRLAYVIYTSGSTGQPKGVMVAHRNVTNFFLGMDQLFKSAGTGRDTLLAVTSMSFDISVLELLWTLTRGDQVVILSERGGIFNEETPGLSLLELLTKHQVTMLQGTPSLMQLIMNSSEGLTELQSLRLLLLGGEPLPMRMAHELCMRVPAALYNMYGPTETTIWSTVMKVEDGSAITIGAPIANTQVYILDEQMNPVPIGVKGELYIGGAGVTCGYLHRPELTSERFVRDPFSAEEAARLYKTGDLARWREQGQIEYLGRLDQQVKIRGHRIEQGEIEAVLAAHEDVREAAVITTQDADPQLVAYVVPEFKRDEVERVEREVLHEQVDQWQVVFEDLYRSESDAEEVVFDTSIWKDSYTGELVAEEQMQEWVDRTVERIVRRNPKRVLEIGCGSGLLLTRVAPQCEHYTATDFSLSVLQSVGRRVQTLGLDTSNIRLLQKMADDFSGLEQETFDLIVINSVVQYFPNVKYLLQVLQQAVEHVKPGGSIFLGDIRHYGLLKEFVASVVLAQANADLSVMELSNLVTQVLQQEEEMVIDPDFFARLPEVIPGITQVEIELKRGHFHNEMSKYRYDVTLHIEQSELQHGEMPAWNWTVATSTLEQVRTHLAVEKPIALRLLNVPNRRLVADVLAARWLDEPHTQRTARDVQKSMAEQAGTGVEPERFFALEEEFPYRVHIGWARSSRKDAYDVTLIRCEPGSGQALPIVSHQLPGVDTRRLTDYANDPLRHKVERRLVAELRRHVQSKLPEYMQPAMYVVLAALPLTPNGKLDRKALPKPGQAGLLSSEFAAPRTEMEERLAAIWLQLLPVGRVGIYDNFFELGGHSLLATQVISRVRAAFGVDVSLRSLFEAPTVADWALTIEQLQKREMQESVALPSLQQMPRTADMPLSFAQNRMWFLHRLEPDSPHYNMSTAWKLNGSLQVEALRQSLQDLVDRQEVLRTVFPELEGHPVQHVQASATVELAVVDLSAHPTAEQDEQTESLIERNSTVTFDPAVGPLFRTVLIKLNEQAHMLLLTMHHIISDGWSQSVFFKEWMALYEARLHGRAAELAPLAVQYADYALWQREWMQAERMEQQLQFWKEQLGDAPPRLEIPTDHPRPPIQTYRGAIEEVLLPKALQQNLKSLCQREQVTLFMLLLAAFQTMLYRYSNQEDLLVGTPIANRNRPEIEDVIGFFVNTLVIRAKVRGEDSFQSLLQQIREHSLNAYAHQDLPFERLVDELQLERDPSRNPLFQVIFALQNTPRAAREIAGLTFTQVEVDNGTSKVDLALFTAESEDGIQAVMQYNTDLFDATTIRRMLAHYQSLLESIVVKPDTRVGELSYLSSDELHQLLVAWNDNRADYPALTLSQLVEAQVEQTPDAIALIDGESRLTYAELNARANQVAHYLQKRGVGAETLVGVCMERSAELLVSLLAILKAGGAYVPLDPKYPAERILFTLEDADAALVLTQEKLLETLSGYQGEAICWERLRTELAQEPPTNLPLQTQPDRLAYVIYTSGSTGRPKGVAIEHRSANTLVQWAKEVYSPAEYAGVLFSTSICFDLSVFEIFVPLSGGGTVILAENALFLPQLPAKADVTLINTVPSAIAELLQMDAIPEGVQVINLAGEPLKRTLVQRLYALPHVQKVYNLYGPSEDTTYSTFAEMEREMTGQPLIGRPVTGTFVYVLNEQMQPVPVGAAGELYLGGAGVARGYLNRPDLTAERFVDNPFVPDAQERLYRTGDLVSYRADGSLAYLGRIDHQVKIRGFRIETGEIEAVLQSHPIVQESLVHVREHKDKGNLLTAYVVPVKQALESNDDIGAQASQAQVSMWQQVFERTYEQAEPLPEREEFQFAGWNSSYTGEALPSEAMQEWVHHTVERILALKPKRVLEIGCGSGLLLSKIAPHCAEYWGTDFSQAALDDLQARLQRTGLDRHDIKLLCSTAEDFSALREETFDLVIINSVVQYFPNASYLRRVLEGAVEVLTPDGVLFVGDVRSWMHNEAFQSSVQLFQAPDSMEREELQALCRQKAEQEKELVIAPEFFYAMQQELDGFQRVEFQLKRGFSITEVTKFRYDVLLYRGTEPCEVPELNWLDWEQERLDLQAVQGMLSAQRPSWFALRRVPNARTEHDVRMLSVLKFEANWQTAGELKVNLQQESLTGLHPEALYRLGEQLSYEVQMFWSATPGDEGRFDVVFRAQEQPPQAVLQPERQRDIDRLLPIESYTSNPVQAELTRMLVPRLRDYLKEKLPEYMVPTALIVLEEFPLTPNGKVDRKALPDPDKRMRHAVTSDYVPPQNAAEETISAVWCEVLGVVRVGTHDNFFDLGGHSLLLVQVHSRLSKTFGNALTVVDLFRFPTVSSLAAYLAQDPAQQASSLQIRGGASDRRNSVQQLQNIRQNNRTANRSGGRKR